MTDSLHAPEAAPWIDLARESDFSLGPAQVRPRTCGVEVEGAEVRLQPRVMQVLVALARAKGELVSRDALVESCWGGLAVGEDAINRCIQRLRRLAETEVPGAYAIQTLPRIGYRLTAGDPLETGAAEPITLAVLPFVNMSADPEQDYFSDGLSEELLNQLAQVRRLRVPARTSSFAFKGRNLDVRVIGETLGVAHVLEGSVRRAGERVRITAQLISCADGYHLWSDAFDRQLDDIFVIQEEVARAVTRALSGALGVSLDEGSSALGGSRHPDAYDRYLRARALYHQQGPAELLRSIEIFREAAALDPDFVLAWRGLFAAHVDALVYQAQSPAEAFQGMAEAGGRILALAPEAWWSHALRADMASHQHNWAGAERSARAAYDLAPATEVEAAFTYGNLLASLGRVKEGIAYVLTLRQADPLSLRASSFVQALLDFAGRPDEAQAEYERSKDLAGDREIAEFLALLRAMAAGAPAEQGRRIAQRILDYETVPMPVFQDLPQVFDKPQVLLPKLRAALEDPAYQDSTRRMKIAMLAAQYGDQELTLAALLRRTGFDFAGGRIAAIWHPAFAKVRRTAEFKGMLSELRLAEHWRATGKWGDFARPLGANDFECA
jgi:TolB-like protein